MTLERMIKEVSLMRKHIIPDLSDEKKKNLRSISTKFIQWETTWHLQKTKIKLVCLEHSEGRKMGT